MDYKILGGIKSPDDVKKLNQADLDTLCAEIRDCIIDTVSKNGGHLASNLGAVELTVALHRVFSSPKDAIIFDVGHQSYTHKLLTGRFDRFSTLRTAGGISGFMRPEESEHDPFITGHSSNSISAAYGIYKAKQLKGEEGTAIAVIGDGAMTGGMAYEALNNAADKKSNFIIVLNDNKMSISKNVGAVSRAFTKMRNKPRYHHFKFALGALLDKLPFIGDSLNKALFKVKEVVKGVVYRKNIFMNMGYNYLGPVDGHNEMAVESLLKIAVSYKRPTIVHVVTTKGKGYPYAESKPNNYHGVSPFDIEEGYGKSDVDSYSDVAGRALCDLAKDDDRICAITAAMTDGTGLDVFAAGFKDRLFDVGIAEQHAVTFAAGLAKGGAIPFFAVYSSFLQRGYDQLIHDAAIADLPLKLLVDRAGIVGEDGESHQGLFDVSYLSSIPNMNIYSPCYYSELEQIIKKTADSSELAAIRYPRGCENKNYDGEIKGDFTVFGNNGRRCIVTYGRLFSNAVDATEKLESVDIIKLNKIYPLNKKLIKLLCGYSKIHIFEETVLSGSISQHISAELLNCGFKGEFKPHTVPDCFVPAAKVSDALRNFGLDTDSMIKAFKE